MNQLKNRSWSLFSLEEPHYLWLYIEALWPLKRAALFLMQDDVKHTAVIYL